MGLLIGLILIAGTFGLQVYLSKAESKWPGRILPILSFLFALLIVPLNMVALKDISTMEHIGKMIVAFLVFNIPTLIFVFIYHVCRAKKISDEPQL